MTCLLEIPIFQNQKYIFWLMYFSLYGTSPSRIIMDLVMSPTVVWTFLKSFFLIKSFFFGNLQHPFVGSLLLLFSAEITPSFTCVSYSYYYEYGNAMEHKEKERKKRDKIKSLSFSNSRISRTDGGPFKSWHAEVNMITSRLGQNLQCQCTVTCDTNWVLFNMFLWLHLYL